MLSEIKFKDSRRNIIQIYRNLQPRSSVDLKRHYFTEINGAIQTCSNSEIVLECLSKDNVKFFHLEIE